MKDDLKDLVTIAVDCNFMYLEHRVNLKKENFEGFEKIKLNNNFVKKEDVLLQDYLIVTIHKRDKVHRERVDDEIHLFIKIIKDERVIIKENIFLIDLIEDKEKIVKVIKVG